MPSLVKRHIQTCPACSAQVTVGKAFTLERFPHPSSPPEPSDSWGGGMPSLGSSAPLCLLQSPALAAPTLTPSRLPVLCLAPPLLLRDTPSFPPPEQGFSSPRRSLEEYLMLIAPAFSSPLISSPLNLLVLDATRLTLPRVPYLWMAPPSPSPSCVSACVGPGLCPRRPASATTAALRTRI